MGNALRLRLSGEVAETEAHTARRVFGSGWVRSWGSTLFKQDKPEIVQPSMQHHHSSTHCPPTIHPPVSLHREPTETAAEAVATATSTAMARGSSNNSSSGSDKGSVSVSGSRSGSCCGTCARSSSGLTGLWREICVSEKLADARLEKWGGAQVRWQRFG